MNNIRAALNCLLGRPTLYRFRFLRGKIVAKGKMHTYIMNCEFINRATIVLQDSEDLQLDDYEILNEGGT